MVIIGGKSIGLDSEQLPHIAQSPSRRMETKVQNEKLHFSCIENTDSLFFSSSSGIFLSLLKRKAGGYKG
jgi:hypothetical protein